MSIQQQNEITTETTALTQSSSNNARNTPHPPSKLSDVILAIHTEIEALKQLRLEVKNDMRRPSKKLSTELYITQQILLAFKNLLLALKDYNINIKSEVRTVTLEIIKVDRDLIKNEPSVAVPHARRTD
jgi:hypothetical protein